MGENPSLKPEVSNSKATRFPFGAFPNKPQAALHVTFCFSMEVVFTESVSISFCV